jgi:single-strand DNA-binding protein
MDLNTVTLSGNLTRDPELRTTNSGKSVVSLRIANNRFGDRTNFFDVTAWEKTAELVASIYSKGDPIIFTGEIQTREYEKDGQKRTATDVVARDVKLPPKGKGAPADDVIDLF